MEWSGVAEKIRVPAFAWARAATQYWSTAEDPSWGDLTVELTLSWEAEGKPSWEQIRACWPDPLLTAILTERGRVETVLSGSAICSEYHGRRRFSARRGDARFGFEYGAFWEGCRFREWNRLGQCVQWLDHPI